MANAEDPETNALAAIPEPAAKSCTHPKLDLVGFDAAARFMRCAACGAILVSQGKRLWQIRSIPVPAV